MTGMVLGENEEKSQISSVQKHDEDLVLLISKIMGGHYCHATSPLPLEALMSSELKNEKNREARGRIYSVS